MPRRLRPRATHSAPTLAVLCPTHFPGPVVHGALAGLRGVADTIVIAASQQVGADDLGWYADAADHVLRYTFTGATRHWPWLARQTDADWLLLLDGDEVPSHDLVAALPELLRDRSVHSYDFPIRWCWPDAGSYLTAEPWASDARARLVRNDGHLRFGAGMHDLIHPARPIAHRPDLVTYHLDLLLTTEEQRRAKIAGYDTEQYGLLAADGRDFNAAHYLPGPEATEALATTPPADVGAIERCLTSRRRPPRRVEPSGIPLADATATLQHWPLRTLGDGAYRARIQLGRGPAAWLARGRRHVLWLDVENCGDALWPGGDTEPPPIRVGMRWESADGVTDAGRAMLPREVAPGATIRLPAAVDGPPAAGPARLVVDVIHEHVRWFGAPLTLDVEVQESVEDELARAAAGTGLVPVAAAWAARVRAGRMQALALDRGREPGAALQPSDVAMLDAILAREHPRLALVAGAGVWAPALAERLAAVHRAHASVLVVEPDVVRAGELDVALGTLGLGTVAPVVDSVPDDGPPLDLLLVERPDWVRRATPWQAIDAAAGRLRPGTTVLLDGAFEDAGLCAARDWERDRRLSVAGIHLAAGGVVEASWRGTPPAEP